MCDERRRQRVAGEAFRRREQTCWELAVILRHKGIAIEHVERVVERLCLKLVEADGDLFGVVRRLNEPALRLTIEVVAILYYCCDIDSSRDVM